MPIGRRLAPGQLLQTSLTLPEPSDNYPIQIELLSDRPGPVLALRLNLAIPADSSHPSPPLPQPLLQLLPFPLHSRLTISQAALQQQHYSQPHPPVNLLSIDFCSQLEQLIGGVLV